MTEDKSNATFLNKLRRPAPGGPASHPLSLLCTPSRALADGLIFQLPKDGVEAVFREETEGQTKGMVFMDGESSPESKRLLEQKVRITGTVTVACVGRMIRARQECRWIELRRRDDHGKGEGHILKMLIPDEYLKQGEDPLDHAILTFFNPKPIDAKGGPKEKGIDRIQYEIDRFRPVSPEPLRDVRDLPKRTVKTAVRTFEGCRVIAGKTRFDRPLLGHSRWTNESDWEIALNPEAPFGVVQILCRSETDEIGNNGTIHTGARSTLTLDKVSSGAKSVLPEPNGATEGPSEKGQRRPQAVSGTR
jgi:hypothetical protein